MKKLFSTPNAPAAIGPYSQAVVSNGFALLSGQIPLDPATGKRMEAGDSADQNKRGRENSQAGLEAGGAEVQKVDKKTD